MTNIELQRLLAQLPPDLEVKTFRPGNMKLSKITSIYIGNSRYLPGSKDRDDRDSIIIEYKR